MVILPSWSLSPTSSRLTYIILVFRIRIQLDSGILIWSDFCFRNLSIRIWFMNTSSNLFDWNVLKFAPICIYWKQQRRKIYPTRFNIIEELFCMPIVDIIRLYLFLFSLSFSLSPLNTFLLSLSHITQIWLNSFSVLLYLMESIFQPDMRQILSFAHWKSWTHSEVLHII